MCNSQWHLKTQMACGSDLQDLLLFNLIALQHVVLYNCSRVFAPLVLLIASPALLSAHFLVAVFIPVATVSAKKKYKARLVR